MLQVSSSRRSGHHARAFMPLRSLSNPSLLSRLDLLPHAWQIRSPNPHLPPRPTALPSSITPFPSEAPSRLVSHSWPASCIEMPQPPSSSTPPSRAGPRGGRHRRRKPPRAARSPSCRSHLRRGLRPMRHPCRTHASRRGLTRRLPHGRSRHRTHTSH
jgi:hypothetical protein